MNYWYLLLRLLPILSGTLTSSLCWIMKRQWRVSERRDRLAISLQNARLQLSKVFFKSSVHLLCCLLYRRRNSKPLMKNENCCDGKQYFHCHNLQNVDRACRYNPSHSTMRQNPWCTLLLRLSHVKETSNLVGFWHWRSSLMLFSSTGRSFL